VDLDGNPVERGLSDDEDEEEEDREEDEGEEEDEEDEEEDEEDEDEGGSEDEEEDEDNEDESEGDEDEGNSNVDVNGDGDGELAVAGAKAQRDQGPQSVFKFIEAALRASEDELGKSKHSVGSSSGLRMQLKLPFALPPWLTTLLRPWLERKRHNYDYDPDNDVDIEDEKAYKEYIRVMAKRQRREEQQQRARPWPSARWSGWPFVRQPSESTCGGPARTACACSPCSGATGRGSTSRKTSR
jgi:hypothetical protein